MDQPRARSAAKSRAVRAVFFDAIAVKRESISSRSKAFQAKHALGLDPGVETGSRRENASNKESSEASPQTDEACGFCGSDRRFMTSSGKTSLKDRCTV